MMSGNFTLSCCSTVDLPYSRMAERGIPVLFYTYTVDDTVYVDDMGRDAAAQDRFYEMLAAGKMPKTSQLNIDNYAQFFESLLSEGKDVLHIALGSGMSNSVNNAFLPAQTSALLSYIDPVVAILLSALLLHEPMDALCAIGAVLVLGSTVLSEMLPHKKAQ